MACFLVPMAEAIVLTVTQKVLEKKEGTKAVRVTSEDGCKMEKMPFSKKLGWLNKLLWGGSALLAFRAEKTRDGLYHYQRGGGLRKAEHRAEAGRRTAHDQRTCEVHKRHFECGNPAHKPHDRKLYYS